MMFTKVMYKSLATMPLKEAVELVRKQARRHVSYGWSMTCPQGCGVELFRAYAGEYNRAKNKA